MPMHRFSRFPLLIAGLVGALPLAWAAAPARVELASGWQLQDVAKVTGTGAEISTAGYVARSWYPATVPGTVLTTLVNNKVYPEPLYGENNRPERIPESLARTAYWYRTEVLVPKAYKGRHVWLNFDGINYAAEVWVNGAQVGTTKGAFIRGRFDVTKDVVPGQHAVVAVRVSPQPHPGVSHEHTLRDGIGQNGGESAIDGPTFLCTIGWDWLPAIRDRATGIWQQVYLTSTGAARVDSPLVTTDLPLPRTDKSDVTVQTTVENLSDKPVKSVVEGTIAPSDGTGQAIAFKREVELEPRSSQVVKFTPADTPALRLEKPRLWWPNGYGDANLYTLHLRVKDGKKISDVTDVSFGVRKITYSVPGTDTLTISVNGVPIMIRGGNWGLDEGLKRIPLAKMDAEIRYHRLANLNLIRNWVGQSTSEQFYQLCDKYGILVWDEFFQPNPGDGPDPTDLDTYIANVRDKILRFRNHPSIMLWCARNEGFPPPEIDARLRTVMAELEPTRRYQPSSTDGAGVRSHGPYSWREPRKFYEITDDYFKTETGTVSVPTLESVHGMMPQKDWESINDDWAEHDFARGNSGAQDYPAEMAARYGKVANLADFVRKAQLMNYEAFRAMYEGRSAKMFHPATAVITWMSHPAQPSFVWQIYHYDMEAFSSLFAVKKANETVHIQLNEVTGEVEVINNLPAELTGATAHATIYGLDGAVAGKWEKAVTAAGSAATTLGKLELPAALTPVYFVRLELDGANGKPVSENFYWQAAAAHPDDFTSLNQLPKVTLEAKGSRTVGVGSQTVTVTLHNPAKVVALMTHLQLRNAKGERILPVFASENYISLAPGETRTVTLTAAAGDYMDEGAVVVVDGWNVSVVPAKSAGVSIAPNEEADPAHWPATGLPYQTENLR